MSLYFVVTNRVDGAGDKIAHCCVNLGMAQHYARELSKTFTAPGSYVSIIEGEYMAADRYHLDHEGRIVASCSKQS